MTAINAVSEQTGVVATHTDDGLLLTAEDGRNMEVIINGAAGPGIAPAAARIYRGGLILSSRRPIEIGGENGAVPGATQTNLLGDHAAASLLLGINVLSQDPFDADACPDLEQLDACLQ